MSEYGEPWEMVLGTFIDDAMGERIVRDVKRSRRDRIIRCVNTFAGVPDSTIDAIAAAGGVAGLLEMIAEFVDPDPCSYDHHCYCQAHSLHEKPCPHERAQALLKAIGEKR